jgi:hypothetical protein
VLKKIAYRFKLQFSYTMYFPKVLTRNNFKIASSVVALSFAVVNCVVVVSNLLPQL